MLRSKITIGAAQEAYDIRISMDQGVFPDLTRFLWLFKVVTSGNIPSLSNISFSLARFGSLYKVAKRGLFAIH